MLTKSEVSELHLYMEVFYHKTNKHTYIDTTTVTVSILTNFKLAGLVVLDQ